MQHRESKKTTETVTDPVPGPFILTIPLANERSKVRICESVPEALKLTTPLVITIEQPLLPPVETFDTIAEDENQDQQATVDEPNRGLAVRDADASVSIPTEVTDTAPVATVFPHESRAVDIKAGPLDDNARVNVPPF